MDLMTPWWDAQTGNMIGATLGVIYGAGFGGIGGGVGGPLASQGKGKPFVLGVFYTGLATGLGMLAFGLAALLAFEQPRHVWWPFLLAGLIGSAVFALLLPVIKMRYRQAEGRALDAQELRRGSGLGAGPGSDSASASA
jgi:F0F1-type ATP synthase membrane subunit c/vacuolar-type H+-ATPase subunit K